MDANEINAKLESFYRNKYKKIEVGLKKQYPPKMRKETGVELQWVKENVNTNDRWISVLKFYDEYFAKGNIRVLFVVGDSIDLLGAKYLSNKVLDENNVLYSPNLWALGQDAILEMMHDINNNINEGTNFNYLCTNLFKVCSPSSSKWKSGFFDTDIDVFRKELHYCKPDFVIFITGKKNDKYISQIYGSSTGFFPNDECADIAVAKCDDDLDYKILRLPIPIFDPVKNQMIKEQNKRISSNGRQRKSDGNAKKKFSNEDIVDIVTRIILHTNYSYNNKLKSYNEKHRKDKTAKLQNSQGYLNYQG